MTYDVKQLSISLFPSYVYIRCSPRLGGVVLWISKTPPVLPPPDNMIQCDAQGPECDHTYDYDSLQQKGPNKISTEKRQVE